MRSHLCSPYCTLPHRVFPGQILWGFFIKPEHLFSSLWCGQHDCGSVYREELKSKVSCFRVSMMCPRKEPLTNRSSIKPRFPFFPICWSLLLSAAWFLKRKKSKGCSIKHCPYKNHYLSDKQWPRVDFLTSCKLTDCKSVRSTMVEVLCITLSKEHLKKITGSDCHLSKQK